MNRREIFSHTPKRLSRRANPYRGGVNGLMAV